MKHRLVPISHDPADPDTRTGWRCVYCGKQWGEIDAYAWFEECYKLTSERESMDLREATRDWEKDHG